MLEQKDLEVLQSMMEAVLDGRLSETTKSIEKAVDSRLSETTKNIEETVDSRLAETTRNIEETVDSRLSETTKSIEETMDSRLVESENLILEEMERTRRILDNKIEQVQKNMEELNKYYRITKLESDNTALLLKMIEGLSKRVEDLERKTA